MLCDNLEEYLLGWLGFPGGSTIKNPPEMQKTQETWVRSLGREDPLEKRMATHSSILAWGALWTQEPGRLQSMGSQRVRHDWAINTFKLFTFKAIITSESHFHQLLGSWPCRPGSDVHSKLLSYLYKVTPGSNFPGMPISSCWCIRISIMLILLILSRTLRYLTLAISFKNDKRKNELAGSPQV